MAAAAEAFNPGSPSAHRASARNSDSTHAAYLHEGLGPRRAPMGMDRLVEHLFNSRFVGITRPNFYLYVNAKQSKRLKNLALKESVEYYGL